MRLSFLRPLLLVGLALAPSACAAALVGAGAGAATGIYLTTRGASGIVEGTVQDVDRRAGIVLARRQAQITERTAATDGTRMELRGKTSDDKDFRIEIKRKTASTSELDVEVREDAVVWDQDQARAIVEQIVAQP